jgi:hypothetical protein
MFYSCGGSGSYFFKIEFIDSDGNKANAAPTMVCDEKHELYEELKEHPMLVIHSFKREIEARKERIKQDQKVIIKLEGQVLEKEKILADLDKRIAEEKMEAKQ